MLVRKHISIFLALFILVSNLGLALNVHYCKDTLASITLSSISNSTNDSECCGAKEKQSKCCHDKIIKSENKADQVLVDHLSFNPVFLFSSYQWEPNIFAETVTIKKADSFSYCCDANAPPLYLLYNQYTFYS
jgi:hypothetical protein